MTAAVPKFDDENEILISLWASRLGGEAQEPTRDRHGWDRLVSVPWPSTGIGSIALDREEPTLTFLVQSKATQGKHGRLRVKLTALAHLVRSPYPAFILWSRYQAGSLARAWLIPVDAKIMRRVLERLRQHSVTGQVRRPHKVMLDVPVLDEHELEPPDHTTFHAAVARHVGVSPIAYQLHKQELLSRLGYENGERQVTIRLGRISTDEMLEALINASMGLSPLSFEASEQFDTRFGINVPVPDTPTGPGQLQVRPSVIDRWTMQLSRAENTFPDLTLTGEVTVPVGLGEIARSHGVEPDRLFRIRFSFPSFESPLGDLVLKPAQGEVNFTPRLDQFANRSNPFASFSRLSRLLKLLGGQYGNDRIYVNAHNPRGELMTGYLNARPLGNPQLQGIIDAVDGISSVVEDAEQQRLSLTLQDLLQARELVAQLKAIETDIETVRVDLHLDQELSQQIGLVTTLRLNLGTMTLLWPVAFFGALRPGTPKGNEGKLHLLTPERAEFGKRELVPSEDNTEPNRAELLTKFSDSLDPGLTYIIHTG